MFYCNDCKQYAAAKFDFDKFTEVCLYCGSEDIERAGECGICKQPINSKDDYCEECLKLARSHIYEVAERVGADYENAKDLILAVIETEDWNERNSFKNEHI